MSNCFSYICGFSGVLVYLFLAMITLYFQNKFSPIAIMFALILPSYVSIPFFIENIEFFSYTSCFSFGVMLILFVFGGLYKSISVRILCDLLEEENNTISIESIYSRYLLQESFRNRLQILVEKGLVNVNSEKKIIPTEEGQILVRRVRFLQKLYGIKASG